MSENMNQRRGDARATWPLCWVEVDNLDALRTLVRDDTYAAAFQNLAQYRDALLQHLKKWAVAEAARQGTVRTWRQRIGVAKDWPLHAPNDVERAMVAEIAELRLAAAKPAQAGQVAPAQPLAMVSPSELRDIQAGRGGVPVRGNQWRGDQTVAIYAAPKAGQGEVPDDMVQAARAIRDEIAAACATEPLLALREMARDGEESLVSSRLLVDLLEALAAAPSAPAEPVVAPGEKA